MTSVSGAARVRVDVTLPRTLAAALREYGRTWKIPLSTVVELASAAYLKDRRGRADQAPFRRRFRQRRGPLAKVERQLGDAKVAVLRTHGGRRL